MTRTVRLTFAPQYVEPILSGGKRATIRYSFERPLAPDDALHMVTPEPDQEHFASARAMRVDRMTAFDAAELDIDGHRAYRDVFDLLDHLRGFYPEATLTPNSDVTVIGWGEHAHAPGEYRWCEVCQYPEPKDRTGYQRAAYPR